MFHIKRDKEINEEIESKKEYIRELIEQKKSPIVLLDPLWNQAKEHIKSEIISKKEEEIKALLKEQSTAIRDYKEYSLVKQNLLKEVLILSEKVQAGVKNSLNEINKCKQGIIEVSDRLEKLEERLDTIEIDIESKNNEVIVELVTIGYSQISKYKETNKKLEDEIEGLRHQMLEKTKQKKEGELFLKDIYHYLHNIIGREKIEVIDKNLGNTN